MLRLTLSLLLPCLLTAQIGNFPWPLAPMDQQHRISATFDECREDRDHFHNGTDMPLAPGGNVLSIMAGAVTGMGADWIRVEDFAYVHVIPLASLQIGSTVAQGGVVGYTDSYAHIHLNYGGGSSGHPLGNPLLPGKLTPFEDPYHPRSPLIQFVQDGTNNAFTGNTLSGRVDIIAQAADTTDLESSIDMNNGVYTIGWALHSADMSETLAGPHFWFEADEYYASTYINNVYAPGSSTSVYRYIVTNFIMGNSYLDCDQYPPGPYVISVMSSDTRDNWDTTYVQVTFSDMDLLPPDPPELTYVGPNANGDLRLEWNPPEDDDLAGYILQFSFNGTTWSSNHGPDVLTAEMSSFEVEGFPLDAYVQFRLKAVDTAPIQNHSEFSDTYAVRLNPQQPRILIVDGFDRTDGSWNAPQHDFVTYYADAVVDAGLSHAIASASNEWAASQADLSQYDALIWFMGDDSRTMETFSSQEQAGISAYLAGGGRLFASGAEIGYDLSAGSAADQTFLNQILHVAYAGDDGGDSQILGIAPHFTGISFTYGSQPYEEDWPDYFTPMNGGQGALQYGNGRTAAVVYRDEVQATCVLGLAFETIDTPSNRAALMERVFQYFSGSVDIDAPQTPEMMRLIGAYPNPFNASLMISYSLAEDTPARLAVFDIRGRKVFEHAVPNPSAGVHSFLWKSQGFGGDQLPSGSYFIQLVQGQDVSPSRKVLLLK